ncbi:hypothetical protein CVT24_006018 [Panaeolus cyanescens]|uniref:F-box domain-containing protein n=1 Tax=Panaeolus cyanescens TaxID=181874 RepID=A0A409YE41_9AGAR|nr:hypothetical protein CVT24_006018 [Panaeolus cyanescens]
MGTLLPAMVDSRDFVLPLNLLQTPYSKGFRIKQTIYFVCKNDTQRRQIDAQVAQLRSKISVLLEQRNAYSPVSKLPPELMSRIFLHARDSLAKMDDHKGSIEWLSLVGVCRNWRKTALNEPQLWTNHTIGGTTEWHQLLLERSKGVPRSVVISPTDNREIIFDILRQPHKIRRLYVTISYPSDDHYSYPCLFDFNPALQTLSSVSAPNLESLVLDLWSSNEHQQHRTDHYKIPPELLGGGTPRLRHLQIVGQAIPDPSHLFRDLSTLKLTIHTPKPFGHACDLMPRFLNVLEGIPGLKKLDVAFRKGIQILATERTRRTVELRALEELNLNACVYDCIAITQNIAFPVSVMVSLVVDFCHGELQEQAARVSELTTALKEAWLSGLCPIPSQSTTTHHSVNEPRRYSSIRAIRISGKEDPGFFPWEGKYLDVIEGWLEADFDLDSTTLPTGTSFIHIQRLPPLTITFDRYASESMTYHFLSKLPLENVASVYLERKLRAEAWDMLSTWPSIKSISTNDEDAQTLIHRLTDPMLQTFSESNSSAPGIPPVPILTPRFPGLTHLSWDRIDFIFLRYGSWKYKAPAANWEELFMAFTRRRDLGTNINSEPTNVDIERKYCDSQITASKNEICRLSSRSNQLVPAATLPAELLCPIFSYVKGSLEVYRQEELTEPHWISITYVCHHWRVTAVNYPALWLDLRFHLSRRWLEAFKNRSAGLPISITVPGDMKPEAHSYLVTILNEPNLLTSLELSKQPYSLPPDTPDSMSVLGAVSASQLHTLILRDKFDATTNTRIPDEFLSGGTPNLRKLYLNHWYLPWNSSVLKGLVSLNVDLGREFPDAMPGELDDFLDALENMPELQDLSLCVDMPKESESTRIVRLPQLKRFGVDGPIEDGQVILEHLHLPTSAHISVAAIIDPDMPEILHPFMVSNFASALNSSWISNPLSNPGISTPALRSIEVCEAFTTICFRGWHQNVDFANYPAKTPIGSILTRMEGGDICPPSLLFVAIEGPGPYFPIPCEIPFHSFPFRDLNSISLGIWADVNLWRVLSDLPFLESISMDAHPALSFVEYLDHDPSLLEFFANGDDGMENDSIFPTYFPNLLRLSFEAVNFAKGQTDTSEATDSLDWSLLVKVLESRDLLKARVERLRLSNVDVERNHCDSQIAALKNEISRLSSKRNQLVTAATLPAELLCQIFLHVQRSFAFYHDRAQEDLGEPIWISITYVCHRWRVTAINYPALWLDLRFHLSKQWLQAFKQRSAGLPISITIPAEMPYNPYLYLVKILKEPNEIASLTMSKRTYWLPLGRPDPMSLLSGASASQLHTLIFKRQSDDTTHGHVPDEFLSGGTPKLHNLTLDGWYLPWNSSMLKGLVSLHVNLGRMSPLAMPGELDDFLDALENMPGLRDLSLCVAMPEDHGSTRIVRLPQLKHFRLDGPIQEGIVILNHLHLPASADLFLEAQLPPEMHEVLYPYLISNFGSALDSSWISNPLSNSGNSRPVLRSIEVCEMLSSFCFHGWHQNVDFANQPAKKPAGSRRVSFSPPSLLYVAIEGPDDDSSILSELTFELFPFRSLNSISLNIWGEDAIWDVLSDLPSLESVNLESLSALSFVEYLDSDPSILQAFSSDEDDTESPPILPTRFPKLLRLSFQGVDFAEGQTNRFDNSESLHWDLLISVLESRDLVNAPIQRLRLSIIFRYVKETCNESTGRRKRRFEWILVTNVCRLWRSVALGYAQLWTDIDLRMNDEWIQTSLQRSQQAPLTVSIPWMFKEKNKTPLADLLKQMHRFCVLEISISKSRYMRRDGYRLNRSLPDILDVVTKSDAPLLKNLVLEYQDDYEIADSTYSPCPIDFKTPPTLHTLHVRGWALPLSSPLFHGLTVLHLNSPNSEHIDDTLSDLLGALESSPGLSELTLSGQVPEGTDHRVVPLHSLKSFELSLPIEDATVLLRHVTIPLSTSIRTTSYFKSNDQSTYKDTIQDFTKSLEASWLSGRLSDSGSTTFRHPKGSIKSLAIDDTDHFFILGWIQEIDFATRPATLDQDDGPEAPFTFEFLQGLEISSSQLLEYFLVGCPLHDLEAISLDLKVPKAGWAALGKMSSLNSVSLTDKSALRFYKYINGDFIMKAFDSEPDPKLEKKLAEASVTRFRNLAHLSFDGVDFGAGEYVLPNDIRAIDWHEFFEFLMYRCELGAPIYHIRFLGCINLWKEDVACATEVVSHVDWDEREHTRDDEDLANSEDE